MKECKAMRLFNSDKTLLSFLVSSNVDMRARQN